jgi:formylglycine-generating enzyme required for sulfatase activity
MPIASVASLVDSLRQNRLLEPDQLAEIEQSLLKQFPDARALAGELINRDWLTPYQINQLFQDHGQDLVLGQYVLLARLGEGGMGKVFKARHRSLGRVVALKVIRKEKLTNPDVVRRFQREVQAAAQLHHPNVVHAFDADQIGGTHFIAMEYIDGIDLSRWLKTRGPLPVEQACDYVRQVALGLQHAYERGLVHRDIKPGNLLVAGVAGRIEESAVKPSAGRALGAEGKGISAATTDPALSARSSILDPRSSSSPWGVVKILDLGLARLHTSGEEDTGTGLTQEGTVVGTVDYLAPEQAMDARAVDIRADIYSLGCSLYHLLSGRPPFPGTTAMEKLLKHRCDEPVPLEESRPEVTPDLAAVVRKMMAKEVGDRYQTPAEVAAALTELIAQGEVTRPVAAGPTAGQSPAWVTPTPPTSSPPPARPLVDPQSLQETTGPWDGLEAFPPSTEESSYLPRPRPARRRRRTWTRFVLPAAIVVVAMASLILFIAWLSKKPDKQPLEGEKPRPKKEAGELPREVTNSIGMKLVWIKPDSFWMGSDNKEPGLGPEEAPRHEVFISQGFYLGRVEVTQAEYLAVMKKNPAFFHDKAGGGPDHPVEQVTWTEANEFCRQLSSLEKEKKAGRVYRLPTEAEWEYACRAGTQTVFHYGNTLSSTKANFNGSAPYGAAAQGPFLQKTARAGSYNPNAWGLCDMHGNVAEWCADYYDPVYYQNSEAQDPRGAEKGTLRVVRGGSWADAGTDCRSARRRWENPETRSPRIGFRVVMTVSPGKGK